MYAVQMVFFTRDLNLSPAMIGVIFTVGSVGGLLGGMAARTAGVRFTTGRTILTGSLLRAAGIALVPLAALAGPAALPLLVVSRLVNAFGWTLWEVHQETMQQLLTPARLRGRVNGSVQFVVQGVDALGAFVGAGLVASTSHADGQWPRRRRPRTAAGPPAGRSRCAAPRQRRLDLVQVSSADRACPIGRSPGYR
ncbi:MFS transporter [Actinopolymorpha alba]|uniref:MFS transporter n=1 Tax=Actinopolymorpha alba TaxID=533267 RepID=UPI0003A1DCFF|nr:MFS transporter [Actinopolymorpha alba]